MGDQHVCLWGEEKVINCSVDVEVHALVTHLLITHLRFAEKITVSQSQRRAWYV